MSSNTRTVNVEDVTQQSKERLNGRVLAVEELAVAHNERVAGEAEAKSRREALEAELAELNSTLVREHKAKHDAALKAGWSTRDLRAMGLDVPTKPTPKRRQRKPSSTSPAQASTPSASSTTSTGVDPVRETLGEHVAQSG